MVCMGDCCRFFAKQPHEVTLSALSDCEKEEGACAPGGSYYSGLFPNSDPWLLYHSNGRFLPSA